MPESDTMNPQEIQLGQSIYDPTGQEFLVVEDDPTTTYKTLMPADQQGQDVPEGITTVDDSQLSTEYSVQQPETATTANKMYNDSQSYKYSRQLYAEDMKHEIVEFFQENPNPSDEELHEWAEEEGYDPHEVEEIVYELATEHVEKYVEDEDEEEYDEEDEYEDEIEGGLADEAEPEEYGVDQLLKGIEIEMEHTDDPAVALEIAMDHLEESDDYYDHLEDMEDDMKKAFTQQAIKRIVNQVKQAQEDEYMNMADAPFEEDQHDDFEYDAEELILYIENTYELYNQIKSIQKNIIKKVQRGVYDPSLAPKLWGYLVQEGAKRYAQEMGIEIPWHKAFPPQVRQEAAQQMASDFESELEYAGDDPMSYFGV